MHGTRWRSVLLNGNGSTGPRTDGIIMTLFNLLFFAIAALIVASTGLAITRRNLVHAVIYLIFGFFGSAFLFYLFGAPFLAALMVIVYAGAIMILFLFIIMMLRVETPEERLFPPRQMLPAVALRRGLRGRRRHSCWSHDPSAAAPLSRGPDRAGRLRARTSSRTAGWPWRSPRCCCWWRMIGALLIGKRPVHGERGVNRMGIPFGYVLALAGIVVALGMVCAVARRNLIMILLGVEIMLNGAAIAFIGAALRWQQLEGQAFVLFIIAIAAAEVSRGPGADRLPLPSHRVPGPGRLQGAEVSR
ncbi:MAG: NADH-quinone oxidoreductase subunit J [Desulfobacterales bacterium]|nr:NADH-quinone oxidoreductase subunit J [Desulfobacterales bacterium]